MTSSRYIFSSLAFHKLNYLLISHPYFFIQAITKFMAVSRQAYELDQQRVRLEAKVHEMERESSHQAEVRAKLEDEVKELKNLIEELKSNAIEKDTHLDHLQK